MNKIRVTPLLNFHHKSGVQNEHIESAVMTLLEIEKYRILLDCGCSFNTPDLIKKYVAIINHLQNNGGIDFVFISHADISHMGALPLLLGKNGLASTVKVVCTLPVYKFGQIMLYDYCLNRNMEGNDSLKIYDFDDIDKSFENVITVKYSQPLQLQDVVGTATYRAVSIHAIPSGRTIGGAMWSIKCGPTEVLYAVDINLKKEIVLDGADIDVLPKSPALMIVDGPGVFTSTIKNQSIANQPKRKKEGREEQRSQLINLAMETLRNGGNVLIPCETGARTLELMQIFAKYWMENQIGLYHLIFLSHMAKNVPEFARMQLEWMSDNLSKGFYNGKANPFDVLPIHLISNIRQMEKQFIGSKVVFATDSSLSCGLSKELLLKWGGDPRCRVIFTDFSDPTSLAYELRMKASQPPIITTINRPVKIELIGEELNEYKKNFEKQKKLMEEFTQRKRRQEELLMLNIVNHEEDGFSDDEEDDEDERDEKEGVDIHGNYPKKKKLKESSSTATPNKINFSKAFLESNFQMLESQEIDYEFDEFGVSNHDLQFHDISSMDNKWQNQTKTIRRPTPSLPESMKDVSNPLSGPFSTPFFHVDEFNQPIVPWKLMASPMKVQFTCEFSEVNISGRSDMKALKTITSKVSPTRIVVLETMKTDPVDLKQFKTFCQSNQIEIFTTSINPIISFQVHAEKWKFCIPQSVFPSSNLSKVWSYSTATNSFIDSKCLVSRIEGGGMVVHGAGDDQLNNPLHAYQIEGTRLIYYSNSIVKDAGKDVDAPSSQAVIPYNVNTSVTGTVVEEVSEVKEETTMSMNEMNDDEEVDEVDLQDMGSSDIVKDDMALVNTVKDESIRSLDHTLGAVSYGEVTLEKLRSLIETSMNCKIEYRLSGSGGVLIIGDQLIIRKDVDGNLIIEGPPIPLYYDVRRVIYQLFTFL